MKKILFYISLFFIFSLQASAKTESITDFSKTIDANKTTTYFDLIHKIFPDAKENDKGVAVSTKSIALDNIFGDYKGRVYEGEMQINSAESLWVKNNGKRQILLLIDVSSSNGQPEFQWGDLNVLALFDVDGEPKLIDAKDVQADRFVFFSEEQPILNLDTKSDAFLVINHHFNAGEGFVNLSLIGVVNNRLKIVLDSIPTLMNVEGCSIGCDEKAFLKLTKNPRNNFSNITVQIKYNKHADGDECEKKRKGYTKNYFHQCVWNEKQKRYIKLKGKS